MEYGVDQPTLTEWGLAEARQTASPTRRHFLTR